MTIKSFALAAAAIAVTASAASADSFFQYKDNLDRSSVLELGIVAAEGNGVVEIYDFNGGQIGDLLGTETVNAGANADVRINVGVRPNSDVIALLKVDGETVATRDYDIAR